jgi:hypothetical protein
MKKTSPKTINRINPDNKIFWEAFEPKTTNRFICYIDNIPPYLLKNIQRPSCVFTRNIFGRKKWKWNPIVLTAYDPINPSGSKAFMSYVNNPISFDMTIKILGPVADVVEEWKLVKAKFTKIDFGNLSWEEKGPVTITATITYDYATLLI